MILLGREKEITRIRDYMLRKRHLIIFGEKGVGKTAIIKEIINEQTMQNILYSPNSHTLKEALVNLVSFGTSSCKGAKNIAQKNIVYLKKLFYKVLDKNPSYLVFDHIAKMGPRYCSLLDYIVLERQTSLIVLSRGLKQQDIGHLGMMSCYFEKIEISNLDRIAADNLTEYFIARSGAAIADKGALKKDVFHYSKGNPKIIRELCLLAADAKYRRKGFLDTKLLDLDRRINELSLSNV